MQGSVTVVVGLETELYLGEGNGRCLFKICASGGKGGGGKIWVSAKNLRSRGREGSGPAVAKAVYLQLSTTVPCQSCP